MINYTNFDNDAKEYHICKIKQRKQNLYLLCPLKRYLEPRRITNFKSFTNYQLKEGKKTPAVRDLIMTQPHYLSPLQMLKELIMKINFVTITKSYFQ